MKKIPIVSLALISLVGRATTSDIVSYGKDSYMLSAGDKCHH
jgi:hypothetical protein